MVWETKKLGEITKKEKFAIVDGPFGTQLKSNEYVSEGIPLVRIKNITWDGDFIDKHLVYITQEKFNSLKRSAIYPGDIILAKTGGTIGKMCLLPERITEGLITSSCAKISIDKKLADNKFIWLYLSSVEGQKKIMDASGGSTRNSINLTPLKDIKIPYPTLEEQKQIVKILDEVFESISKSKENAEKNLKNAKELFESYLEEIFSNPKEDWEEKKLEEIAKIQTGTTPKTSEKDNIGNFIPFIKPADFNKDGSINYENFGLSEKGLKQSRLIEKNSVLMVCIGATIGKTGFTEKEISCNQQINSLTLKKDLFPKLFYYALITKRFKNEVLKNSGQATIPIINKTKWSRLKVYFPKSLPEQTSIVQKLDSLSSEIKQLEEIYKQKLKDLEELKKSMLQKAFSGELTKE